MDKKKIVASIEARMSSSRLPGKVLMPINGVPNLSRIVRRLRHSQYINEIIVATSTEKEDDAIEVWSKSEKIYCFRGSLDDVLDRVVCAHESVKSDTIVEITGDMTLVDPQLIDMGIETYFSNICDVVTNVNPSTFPSGADIQVFSFDLLKKVSETISDPAVREHVSLHFYENPQKFRLINLIAPKRWKRPDIRFDLDYKEDLVFLNTIYKNLESKYGDNFGIEEVISFLNANETLLSINKTCKRKSVR